VQWPENLTPERAPIYALNEIRIPAEPARIWPWLTRAKRWPEWYSNCAWMRLDAEELGPGVEFTWKTFGVVIHSKVLVFEPNAAIEWDGKRRLPYPNPVQQFRSNLQHFLTIATAQRAEYHFCPSCCQRA